MIVVCMSTTNTLITQLFNYYGITLQQIISIDAAALGQDTIVSLYLLWADLVFV